MKVYPCIRDAVPDLMDSKLVGGLYENENGHDHTCISSIGQVRSTSTCVHAPISNAIRITAVTRRGR